uniref:Uncharacterized protein n=1 Tax=Venturia canescens TaxID=32260 RepID=A0A0U1ZKP2_9HYME|nr:hypothetical protein [Venturia canescens]
MNNIIRNQDTAGLNTKPSSSVSWVCSVLLSLVVSIICVLVLVLLVWIYYSNYMKMYRPYIDVSLDVKSLDLAESFRMLSYLKQKS